MKVTNRFVGRALKTDIFVAVCLFFFHVFAPISYGDRIRVGQQVLTGTILDVSTAESILLRTTNGGMLLFSRSNVTILDCPGVVDASYILHSARTTVANADKLLDKSQLTAARIRYTLAEGELARIRKPAYYEYAQAQSIIASCAKKQLRIKALEPFQNLAQRADTLIAVGIQELAEKAPVASLQWFSEAEKICEGIDDKDARAFYEVDKKVRQSQAKRSDVGADLLKCASELLVKAADARRAGEFEKASAHLSEANKSMSFDSRLLVMEQRQGHAAIVKNKKQEESLIEVAVARQNIKKARGSLSEATRQRELGDYIAAKHTLNGATDQMGNVNIALLDNGTAEDYAKAARDIAAEITFVGINEAEHLVGVVVGLLDNCRTYRLMKDTVSAGQYLDQAEWHLTVEGTNNLCAEARQLITSVRYRVESERYLIPASSIRNLYLKEVDLAGRDPNELERLLRSYRNAHARLVIKPPSDTEQVFEAEILSDFARIEAKVRECGWIPSSAGQGWAAPSAENLLKVFMAAAEKADYSNAIPWFARLSREYPETQSARDACAAYDDMLYKWGASLAKAGKHSEAIGKFDSLAPSRGFTRLKVRATGCRLLSSGVLFWQAHVAQIVIALFLVIFATVGAAVYLNRPSACGRRALAEGERISRDAEKRPAVARKRYARLIKKLEARALAARLESRGRQALGLAYLKDASLALSHTRNRQEAEESYEKAQRYIPVERGDMAVHFVAALLANSENSEESFEWYVSYLGLPFSKIDRSTVTKVEALLNDFCHVNKGMADYVLVKKLRQNMRVAAIPGPAPRLVVIRGSGTGTQCPVSDRISIGSASDNDVVLNDEGVAKYHAVVRRTESGLTVTDASTGADTLVHGERIIGESPLRHGSEIICGAAVIRCVIEQGALEKELAWPHLNLGTAYFLKGEYEKARASLNYAIRLKADSAEAYWYLGCVERNVKNYSAAFSALTTATTLEPGHHRAHHALGLVLIALANDPSVSTSAEKRAERLGEAIDHIAAATRLSPSTPEYFFDLANAYLENGRDGDALAAVQTAICRDGTSARYRVLLSRLAQKTGDAVLAREAIKKALQLDPANLEANLVYGDMCFEDGEYAEAVKRLDYIRQSELKAGAAVLASGSRFFYRLGRSLFETGRYVPASVALETASEELRDAGFYGGRCHTRTGHFDSAVEIFQMVLDQFGDDPEVRYYQASCHGHLGQFEVGAEVLRPVENDAAWGTRVLCLSARLLAGGERYEEAQAKLAAARISAPEAPEVYMESGRVAYVRGMHDQARSDFETVLRLRPYDAEANLWLGRCYFAGGMAEESERFFREALLSGESRQESERRIRADAHDYLGRTAFAGKRAKEAIQHFEEARALGISSARLAFDLALAYAEVNVLDKALSEFSLLASEYPDSRDINLNVAAVSARMANRYLAFDRFSEAVPLFEQAIELYDKENDVESSCEVRTALSEVLLRVGVEAVAKGNLADGCRALTRARELTPLDTRANFYLGVALFRQSRFDAAEECFGSVPVDDANYQNACMGKALAREQTGHQAEAEQAWLSLLGERRGSREEQVRARLGFAGYLARQGRWRDAAENIHTILDSPEAKSHPLHDQMCRIAVSYLGLSGDDSGVREFIEDHLTDVSPESADFYLGAILAQQDKLDAAHERLSKIIKKKSVLSDDIQNVRDLYAAICLAISARKTMAGDFAAAVRYASDAAEADGAASLAAKAFRDVLEAAILLSKGTGDLNETMAQAYESAVKRDPDNKSLLRNYAVVAHRLALMYEQAEDYRRADPYWKKASRLWQQLIDAASLKPEGRNKSLAGFWEAFAEQFNEGKKSRDCLKAEDVSMILIRVIETCRGLHASFAKAHIARRSLENVKRHVLYAMEWPRDNEYSDQLVSSLVTEALPILRDSIEMFIDFAEFLWNRVGSKNEVCRSQLFEAYKTRGAEALWKGKYADFQSHMRLVASFADSKKDAEVKEKAIKASRIDKEFIARVMEQTRLIFNAAHLSIGDDGAKLLAYLIVLGICSKYDQMQPWQRNSFDDANLRSGIVNEIMLLKDGS